MTVYEFIKELSSFNPYAKVSMRLKSGEIKELKISDLKWDGYTCIDDDNSLNREKINSLNVIIDVI